MESCQRSEMTNKTAEMVEKTSTEGQPCAPVNPGRKPRGLSAAAVLERFRFEVLDVDRCRELLIEVLHPRGLVCRVCGCEDFSGIQEVTFRRFGRVQCRGCGRFFTARSGTVLEGSGLSEQQVVMIAAGVALGLHTPNIADLARVHPETVRRWRGKLG